ncbi:hypothetical protein Gasu2_66670 [Galdieria sulphuraria]|uniref:DUF202 domain-containing protein n=1 Tax=Galdieria sulphuraria TaxID=130081 RepID=M2WSM7_GALSU|nr:uncharacterized protein Gasu_55370 [Galdieria sulphuraria]EME26850.1 hypothetical protein Gasu_55370 [Galdieria sulphuraria]GJD12592.1 hypothetical protein Gasu2_66670 [Galdieria sulphuraria]|eukprot:XP_005703370.1 hypothetical protein Gasu_55370 [Galdieria sulphuraria]
MQWLSHFWRIPYTSYLTISDIIIALVRYRGQANRGARARNLFSSERTFNSWLRSGLGAMALGTTASKYVYTASGKAAAILLFCLGVIITFYCLVRHYHSVFQIEEDILYSISVLPVTFSILAVALAVTIFVLVLLDESY